MLRLPKNLFIFLLILLATACSSGTKARWLSGASLGPYHSQGLDRELLNNSAVIEAMSRVPRHEFVSGKQKKQAYEDKSLSIGEGQTITQPYMVALMTQESEIGEGAKVLEIGTGSGYQAAVASELGARVYSIEIIEELANQADSRLKNLGYQDIQIKHGNGWDGWEAEAPFDAIIVTAAAPEFPDKLFSQLANRGKMILPIGEDSEKQNLVLIERDGKDMIMRNVADVRFVSMTGKP